MTRRSVTPDEYAEARIVAPRIGQSVELPHQNLIEGTLEVAGYLEGRDYEADYPAGRIANLAIPAGTPLDASYQHEDVGGGGFGVMRDGTPLPARGWLNLAGGGFDVAVGVDRIDVSGVESDDATPFEEAAPEPGWQTNTPVGYYSKDGRVWLEGWVSGTAGTVVARLPEDLWPAAEVRLRTAFVSAEDGSVTARADEVELDGESYRLTVGDAFGLYPPFYPGPDTYPSAGELLYPPFYPGDEVYPRG